MKLNKKRHIFLLSGLFMLALSGCMTQNQPPNTVISDVSSETISNDQIQSQESITESIYNETFEKYNDITELAVIVNNPTKEDLECVKVPEKYGDEKLESMLIIPKYNGSKITISTAEYTGAQYIAKEDLFTVDSTPSGYGLQLFANRPEGIPELIITISYQKANRRYVVTSSGKEDNTGIEHLRVEADASSDKKGDMVSPIEDPNYINGLNLFSSSDVDIDNDGEFETLEVYCEGSIGPNGDYLLDDGENWTLILRKGERIYPLFDKAYIQFGKIQYAIYQDYNDFDRMHVIVECKTGTAIYYYDCIYDEESGNMIRNSFFDASNINMIKSW